MLRSHRLPRSAPQLPTRMRLLPPALLCLRASWLVSSLWRSLRVVSGTFPKFRSMNWFCRSAGNHSVYESCKSKFNQHVAERTMSAVCSSQFAGPAGNALVISYLGKNRIVVNGASYESLSFMWMRLWECLSTFVLGRLRATPSFDLCVNYSVVFGSLKVYIPF